MERFYTGHTSMRLAAAGETARAGREDLRRLLTSFAVRPGANVGLDYSFAACEIGVRRDGSVDGSAYRTAVCAGRLLVEWTRSEIDRAFANRHAPISRDANYLRVCPRPRDGTHAAVMRRIGPSYGALLKITELCSRPPGGGAARARARLEEFIDWMMDTLGICLPYEMRVAAALVAGSTDSQRRARKLLRFSGDGDADDLAAKAWNAAWDLWFLRLPEGDTFGLLPSDDRTNEVTALVTRNHDPLWLREGGSIRALIGSGSDRHIMTELLLDVRSDGIGDAVLGLVKEKFAGGPSPERLQRDPDAMADVARRAIEELEREMGVSVRTGSRA